MTRGCRKHGIFLQPQQACLLPGRLALLALLQTPTTSSLGTPKGPGIKPWSCPGLQEAKLSVTVQCWASLDDPWEQHCCFAWRRTLR